MPRRTKDQPGRSLAKLKVQTLEVFPKKERYILDRSLGVLAGSTELVKDVSAKKNPQPAPVSIGL